MAQLKVWSFLYSWKWKSSIRVHCRCDADNNGTCFACASHYEFYNGKRLRVTQSRPAGARQTSGLIDTTMLHTRRWKEDRIWVHRWFVQTPALSHRRLNSKKEWCKYGISILIARKLKGMNSRITWMQLLMQWHKFYFSRHVSWTSLSQ